MSSVSDDRGAFARELIEALESPDCPYFGETGDLERDARKAAEFLLLAQADIETLTRRLAHSERHRTMNRRSMRQRGRVIRQLGEKIARQREALRSTSSGGAGYKRLSAMERASDLHRSLRSGTWPADAE